MGTGSPTQLRDKLASKGLGRYCSANHNIQVRNQVNIPSPVLTQLPKLGLQPAQRHLHKVVSWPRPTLLRAQVKPVSFLTFSTTFHVKHSWSEICKSPKSCFRSPRCAKAETPRFDRCTELLPMQGLHLLSYLASWTVAMKDVAGTTQKMQVYKEVNPRHLCIAAMLSTTTEWARASDCFHSSSTGSLWGPCHLLPSKIVLTL